MKKNLSTPVIAMGLFAAGVIIIALWVMGTYNSFIGLRENTDTAWAQVETQYQRRADLVPQLVATVRGAADFEESVLTQVTEARTNWQNTASNESATIEDQIAASASFDSALSRLLVTVESYPVLTATSGFLTLQSQLEGTENRVSVSRFDYNTVAKDYNIATQLVPAVFIANIFGFDEFPLFESKEGAEDAPEVNFDFK
jgi:LemA protein